jgi:translation elongation factor Ts
MSISASAIKELRETTGAGMMDCKKALTEANGNMEEAQDWLRKKGLASAAKKSGRVAAEGLVGVAAKDDGSVAAMVEINSETDFVARNDQFQQLVEAASSYSLEVEGELEKLLAHTCKVHGKSVSDVVTDTVATIGENIQIRRTAALSVNPGVVCSYIHNAVKPNMGKIGILVALQSEGDKAKLEAFGKKLAMHIAAARPLALTRDGVDATAIERERAIFKEQAMASGKPAEIAEKMVEGRIRKFYEEVVLPEQEYVIEGKIKVSEAVENFAKELGSPVEIVAFERFELGEGVEKKDEDFAEEVAKAAGAA